MPIHVYSNWNKRATDQEEKIEPYRHYYFICEGEKTEPYYIKSLINNRKKLGIHPLIDIRLMEKTGKHTHLSAPSKLVDFAIKQKEKLDNYDKKLDRVIIVFDADVFETMYKNYDEIVEKVEQESDNILGVTNPGFELFLLLHLDDAYEKYIKGHEKEFMTPTKGNSYGYAYELVKEELGIDPKKNPKIGDLANDILKAIEEEKNINQDTHNVKGKITSNIGQIIAEIINEKVISN